MLYLILLTFLVFLIFWIGDFVLTIKTTKYIGKVVEINPILRGLLRSRGRFIHIFKIIEIGLFLYLLYFITTFSGVLPFYILLGYIFIYSIAVVNNAHVYYKATKKENGFFKVIFIGLVIAMLLFIYLDYLLYLDLNISYNALSKSNQDYNELYEQCQKNNVSISTPEPRDIREIIPELNLPIRRSGLE